LLHRLYPGAPVHDRNARAAHDPAPRDATHEDAGGERRYRRHAVLRLLGRQPRRLLGARSHTASPLRPGVARAGSAPPRGPRELPSDRPRRIRHDRRARRRASLRAGDHVIGILDPGPQTTVQDLGRSGQLRYGVPPSGPVDRRAFVLANRLVGNPDGAAALEGTLIGPRFEVDAPCAVAVTGADTPVTIHGREAPAWTTLTLKPGDVAKLGPARSGVPRYGAVPMLPESDRMGARLSGERDTHARGHDIISDGIALGSIQIPGDGLPIVLLVDRQTTGGYTKVATVCSFDIGRVGQVRPGQSL